MARNLTTTQQINNYVQAVIQAANHHAPNVSSVISMLEREVLNKLNLGPDTVKVYERNGQIARTCWITLNGSRYVFTYNYNSHKIDLKTKGLQGNLIADFDNSSSNSAIIRIIQGL